MSVIDASYLTQLENQLERLKAGKVNDSQACDAALRVSAEAVHAALLGPAARSSLAKTSFNQGVRVKKSATVLSTGPEFERAIQDFLEHAFTAAGFPAVSGGGGLFKNLFGGGGKLRPAAQSILFAKIQKAVVEFISGTSGRQVAEKILALGRDHLLDSVTSNRQVLGELEILARKHDLAFRVNDTQLSATGTDYVPRLKTWLEQLVRQTVLA